MFPLVKAQLSLGQRNFFVLELHLTDAKLGKTGIPQIDFLDSSTNIYLIGRNVSVFEIRKKCINTPPPTLK